MSDKIEFVQEIVDRMKSALGVERDRDVADFFQTRPANVSVWKKRGTIPVAECIEMAQKLELSLDWLMLGRGDKSMFIAVETKTYDQDVAVPVFDPDDLRDSKKFPAKKWWVVSQDWISKEGLDRRETIIVNASGDAMAGTIEDGQLVVVDLRPRTTDGVYLLRFGGAVRMKRLQRMADSSLRLSNDNAAYAVDVLPETELDKLDIIGYCHATVKRLR